MRPDEHKKRKNTQYKKKHGMKSDSKQQSNDKTDDKQVKSAKQTFTKAENSGKHETRNRKVASDDEEYVEEQSYRKRQLVSNWSRYDDIPSDDDDDLPLQRGEDFNKLLAEAGGSAAQFRFKDEEDWSGDVEATSSDLALDLENIAESLQCIPLHERLGINQDLFTAEQLAEIQSSADECQLKYDPTAVKSKPPQAVTKTSKHEQKETTTKNASLEDTSCVNKDKEHKTITDSAMIVDKCNDKPAPEKRKPAIKSEEIACLEDDLDLLLSMDNPVKDNANSSSGAIKCDNNNKIIEIKDKPKTEQLQHVGKESKVTDQSPDEKDASKGDDLEDWLDSMLDD